MNASRGGRSVRVEDHLPPELAPELFDAGAERHPTSGQFSAAALVGFTLVTVELLAAPLVLIVSLAVSVATWWLLDAPWSGRRRHARRHGINSRLLYLSTLMLVGLWLGVMFIFRASDPSLSSGFTTTLPVMIWGIDVSLLQRLNGMDSFAHNAGTMPVPLEGDGFAPFSLFVHGTVATVGISLMAYSIASARRRLRRRLREKGLLPPRAPHEASTPPIVR